MIQAPLSLASDGTSQHTNDREQVPRHGLGQGFGQRQGINESQLMTNSQASLHFDGSSGSSDSGIIGNAGGLNMFRPRECVFYPSISMNR